MNSDEGPESGWLTRRRALQALGAGSTIALAGCLHDDNPCDLSLEKTDSGETVTYGGTAAFEISVCNEGEQTCTDPVTVTDSLPAGTTFDSVSGSGWSATASGNTVTCEHPNSNGLTAGSCLPTLVLTVTVGQQSAVGPEIANCASLGDVDENLTNNRSCVKVPVEDPPGECDLSIAKTYDGDVVTAGTVATFQIEVCNDGDGDCVDPVTVVDGLPAGVTYDSASGTGWSVSQSGGSVVATHQNSGGLAPGSCLPVLDLTVQIGSIDETGDQIRNCATLKGEDANPENDRDCVTVPVRPGGECDLAITKSLDGDAVTAGTSAVFEITVCNEGDGACDGPVNVVDGLPAGVTFDSAAGTGWSTTVNNGIVTATHQNSGGLAAGACLPTLELTVQIGFIDETGDQIRNCASVEGSDVNNDNNRDCLTVPVLPGGECDLSISKTHASDVVTAGSTTTFEITVCNDGTANCPDAVSIVDDLPDGVSFDSASGAGWSASESNGTVTANHQNSGGLAAGSCLPVLTLTVQIGSLDETGDQIRNCAVIENGDPNAENNRDCVVVGVTQPTGGCNGLTVGKTTANQFMYGQQGVYELTVCNPTDAPCDSRIVVTDDIPGGMSYVSHSGSGWNVSVSGGVITATHPNNGGLAAGACLPTLTITVDVVPANQFPGGSDAVQNCADLVVDGAVVDQGCVTHVITN